MTKSIQSLFAYIATDPEGAEYVPVLRNVQANVMVPLIFTNRENADEHLENAQVVANMTKADVYLVEFTVRSGVKIFKPNSEQN